MKEHNGEKRHSIAYACANRACRGVAIRAGQVEPIIFDLVAGRLAMPDAVDLLRDNALDEVEAERLRTERQTLRERLGEIADERSEGLIDGKGYAEGSTRNWRQTRQSVLNRDFYECQLRLPGCLGSATEVHHKVSVAARRILRTEADDPLDELVSVCGPCHSTITKEQTRRAQARAHALRAKRRKLPQSPHPGET